MKRIGKVLVIVIGIISFTIVGCEISQAGIHAGGGDSGVRFVVGGRRLVGCARCGPPYHPGGKKKEIISKPKWMSEEQFSKVLAKYGYDVSPSPPRKEDRTREVVQDPRVDDLKKRVDKIETKIDELIATVRKIAEEVGLDDIDINDEMSNEESKPDKHGKVGNNKKEKDVTIGDISEKIDNYNKTITEVEDIIDKVVNKIDINKEEIRDSFKKKLKGIKSEIEELKGLIEKNNIPDRNNNSVSSFIKNKNAKFRY